MEILFFLACRDLAYQLDAVMYRWTPGPWDSNIGCGYICDLQ